MKKIIFLVLNAVFLSCMFFAPLTYGDIFFTDTFEDGNLNNWTIGGRQAEGTNIADVVSYNGSLSGHLYKFSFTEITMFRDFQYDDFDNGDLFSFDLAVDVYSSYNPYGSNYYGWAGLTFQLLDSGSSVIGEVYYGAATTDYPFTGGWGNYDWRSINQIAEGTMNHYDISIENLLSQITIDSTQIAAIRMEAKTYSSTRPNPTVNAELWIDNVNVGSPVPLPSAIILLGSGILGVAGVVRRKNNCR